MVGVGNGDAQSMCGMCLEFAMKTPEQRHFWLWEWLKPCFGVPFFN